jgi:CDP-diglyceride synthetase
MKVEKDCGLDPITWCQIYFGILLLGAFLEVLIFFFLKCRCSGACIIAYYSSTTIFVLLGLVIHIIYGYTIYFSDENECQKSPDQFGWLVLMVILLFFGIFMIIGFAILLCVVCCVGAAIAGQPSGPTSHASAGAAVFYNPA